MTLALFAAQAALAIANALRYREERRGREYLETLVNTSPVGVVVFDAGTGAPVSWVNREARRIVDSLRDPDQTTEQLLEVVQLPAGRRAGGLPWSEFPLTQRRWRPVRRCRPRRSSCSVSPMGAASPPSSTLRPSAQTRVASRAVVVTLQDLTPLEEIERQRAAFLGTVSHELRTPLTSIKGSTAALLRTPSALDAAETRQFLRIIDSQADHLLDLIGAVAGRGAGSTPASCRSPRDPRMLAVLVDRAVDTLPKRGGPAQRPASTCRLDLP